MDPQFLRSIEALLTDLPLDPDGWTPVLEGITRAMAAHGAAVLPLVGRVPGSPITRSLEPLVDDYYRDWADRDARMRAMPQLMRSGVASDQDVFDAGEMGRHPYWREYLEPHGLRWFAGIRIDVGSDVWCLALQRTPEQGAFPAADQADLLRLAKPMSRAATLSRRLAEVRLEGLTDALDLVGQPAFLVDRHARLVRHNAEAEALLRNILSVRRGEVSVDGRADLTAELRRHLGAAIQPDLDPASPLLDGIAVPRPAGSPLFLQAHPIRRALAGHFTPGCALLLVTDPDLRSIPRRAVLRTLFALSEREAQLVQLLADGRTLTDAAKRLGVSYETARTYVKSVFAKTGARGQSGLIAVASRLGRT